MTLSPASKIADAQVLTYQALKVVNLRVVKAREEFRSALGRVNDTAIALQEVREAERVQEALQAALASLKTAIDAYERS